MMYSFRDVFGETLCELGETFKNLVVLDTDLSKSTRTVYFARKFPDRFIQVGISEQDAVGMASGLAISGKIPVLAVYSMFLLRAWEQIRNTVARDNLNVKLIGTHSGLSDYLDGASHQCFEDIALMRILPNFTVVSPSDTTSTKSLLKQILSFRGPVYMRIGRDNSPHIYEDEEEIILGKANILFEGSDITLVSHGAMTQYTLEVAEKLTREGFTVNVIDMHTIKPLDIDILSRKRILSTPIFVIEDHSIYGGLGSAIAEYLSMTHPSHVYRIGVEDRFGTGAKNYLDLLEYMGFTPNKIVNKIKVVLNGI